jgi:hypothetical protein
VPITIPAATHNEPGGTPPGLRSTNTNLVREDGESMLQPNTFSQTVVRGFVALSLLLAGLTFALAQGQGQGQRQARDPLAGLKRALAEANAPALTTQQETDLNALITAYRNGLPTAPNENLRAAHTAYSNAIAAGDLAAATAAAATIANLTSTLTQARLQAAANLAVQALNVLKTNAGQVEALTTRFGTTGLSRILQSLGGRGGFGGPGGPGHGPNGHEGGPAGPRSGSSNR